MALHKLISVSEFGSDTCRKFQVGQDEILVVKLEDGFYAVDDLCSHADASLCDGEIEGDEVICPLHFARFNIRSGAVTAPPALEGIRTFKVEVVDGNICVEV
jgi:3-phenylpropionate/trans-cinnamate dioxygenase ferredoxin component